MRIITEISMIRSRKEDDFIEIKLVDETYLLDANDERNTEDWLWRKKEDWIETN